MEPPECPVCLQSYDGEDTIPRVLSCGHSACELCLKQLPQKHSHTIRCPACTQLVKLPNPQGPSALPKNIDLLRFSLSENPNPNSQKSNSQKPIEKSPKLHQFIPHLWSDEFYATWKEWILPKDAVVVEEEREEEEEEEEEEEGGCCLLQGRIASSLSSMSLSSLLASRIKENQTVSLVRITCSLSVNDSVFDYSCIARIMDVLSGLSEEQRNELGLILKACSRQHFVCKAFGFWYNSNDRFVYLVCEKYGVTVMEKLDEMKNEIVGGDKDGLLENWAIEDGVSGFARMGMELCEGVSGLHSEGLVIGCLGLSCLSFDEFGHVCIDVNEILVTGRKVRGHVVEAIHSEKEMDDEKLRLTYANILKSNAFISPELLYVLLRNEGIECGRLDFSVGYSSDVWSLACMLLRLLLGKQFTEEIFNDIHHLPQNTEDDGLDYLGFCRDWMEKVGSLLETKLDAKFVTLPRILCNCLNFDPGSRPHVTDVWKCIRELIVKRQVDIVVNLEGAVHAKNKGCLAAGELCKLSMEINKRSEGMKVEDDSTAIADQIGEMGIDKDIAEGVIGGNVKFIPMQGHLDSITGLAVGGGFLFSSSFDKMINVWSLQDFSHVHSFKGHEHRVMGVVFVDGEQPFCISGDSGGGIFIWDISVPLGQEPLKKWYEEKDWRYSGIHALTISGTEYLYTGSGDKLIKAWSLRDYTLTCSMSGHKSVVSALAVCDGVLYSGSWDGTIRLWSLNDHSPLTVLGEDTTGNVTSVLSLSAKGNMLAASHDNGCIKIWRDDVFKRSMQTHNAAALALCMEGKWLFSGGWDKTLNVQELSGDEFQMDARPVGSIACDYVITALLYWQGKLVVGYADRSIKVYYYGR